MTDHIGIDIGSTTVKIVVTDDDLNVVYSSYRRHNARIRETLLDMLREYAGKSGSDHLAEERYCTAAVTGSGGLSLADAAGIEFVQEVIAVTKAVRRTAPETDVVIELGGEDAKIIYFGSSIEQRMNGICAGGTGSFIDQMASLLKTDPAGLNEYAAGAGQIYPIAARCGVFAKTDIQPLINDGVSREDIATSIFQAVVNQTISGLACGRRIEGHVAFLGGPLHFLPELRRSFARTLELSDDEVIFPENAHLFAALGAAEYVAGRSDSRIYDVNELADMIAGCGDITTENTRMRPIFRDDAEYSEFRRRQEESRIARRPLAEYKGKCFLGIDAGSTTTKLALISEDGELLYSCYGSNEGEPISVIRRAFRELGEQLGDGAEIAYSCSTGYGEDLIRECCNLDEGEVETIAHYYAARSFMPEVDCILDIGGQDMKCISIRDGAIDNIMLNEACSSGCGSFIENFACSLGYTAEEFAELAVRSDAPIDLGTRCTVFMNSNVKQAQKEGTPVEDIAAGLAYSVIRNALYKVIRVRDPSALGHNIVVQGGTFMNDAVLRALELTLGRDVVRPDIAGLMGAFGAALIARERYEEGGRISGMMTPEEITCVTYEARSVNCKGCSNQCRLTVNKFSNGNTHITGNRCENGLASANHRAADTHNEIPDISKFKINRILHYEPLDTTLAVRGSVGIPRVLNMYEDFPFWEAFFRTLGFRVVLSPPSSGSIFRLGMDSIPSESECYPAKLVHGHIRWLIDQELKTIFYPCVVYETRSDINTQNSYNCPMVISYPETIRNNIDEIRDNDVRFIEPFISFDSEDVLASCLGKVMREEFDIPERETRRAVREGWESLRKCRQDIADAGRRALNWMEKNGRRGIVLAGRPYHMDPEINHGIPELIRQYGYAVLTEDSVAWLGEKDIDLRVTNQWIYHSRLYSAAEYVCTRDDLELVQLNSFGCGLDAVTIDQVQDLLSRHGRLYTLIKIDEISNLGAVRIRLRSLFAAIRMREGIAGNKAAATKYERVVYTREMQESRYTLICPNMTSPHFEFVEAAARTGGYNVVMIDNEGPEVIEKGIRYVNNDACYPAMIVTGQIMDAVLSGHYDVNRLGVLMAQTGGGCRASNYVGFIRKALKDAGYPDIPVISINLNGMERNPGFHISPKILLKALQGCLYGDLLTHLTRRTRPYEVVPGSVNELYETWVARCLDNIGSRGIGMLRFQRTCKRMIRDFDRIEIRERPDVPRVGIVGEVLVKYMPMANNHLADYLESEGAEVVMPGMLEFLKYCISSAIYKGKYLGRSKLSSVIARLGIDGMDLIERPLLRELRASSRFSPHTELREVRAGAEPVLQEGNQCGEGWFLAGEMIDLIREGVNNIICVQPFGCLPNHVVGKGVIKRIREMYPEANIVAVDYDPSASRVNQINRIKLMLENARGNLEVQQ